MADKKDKTKDEVSKSQSKADEACCYYIDPCRWVDPCGCYVDPCGCHVSACCC